MIPVNPKGINPVKKESYEKLNVEFVLFEWFELL